MRTSLVAAVLALTASTLGQYDDQQNQQQEQITLECVDNDLIESIPDDSQFSILKAALQYASAGDLLRQGQALTLFAPNNDAMEQLFPNFGERGLVHFGLEHIREILLTHIVFGEPVVRRQQIVDQGGFEDVTTALQNILDLEDDYLEQQDEDMAEFLVGLQEDCSEDAALLDVTIEEIGEEDVVTVSAANSAAQVVTADIQICQAVVHEINTVLIPDCTVEPKDLEANEPQIAALDEVNIDFEEAGIAEGPLFGTSTFDERGVPLTAEALNMLPSIVPAPMPAPSPALGPGEEMVDAVAPALGPGEEEVRDIVMGPGPDMAPGMAPGGGAVPGTPGSLPVTDGTAPTVPGEGPTSVAPTPEPVPAFSPAPGPSSYATARAGVIDVNAPGPAEEFFGAEAYVFGPEGALTDEATRDLANAPGFSIAPTPTPVPAPMQMPCILLGDLDVGLVQLNEASGNQLQRFARLFTKSPDLVELVQDGETTATVFIPVSAALSQIAEENPDALSANVQVEGQTYNPANELLRYHIIPGFNTPASEFAAAALEDPLVVESAISDEGKDICESTLTVAVPEAGKVTVNGVPVAEADLISCDGRIVFHILEGALNPQCNNEVLTSALQAAQDEEKQQREINQGILPGTPGSSFPAEGPGSVTTEPSGEEPPTTDGDSDDEPPTDDDSAPSLSLWLGIVMAVVLAMVA